MKKKILWFTHTNIVSKIKQNLTFDLTEYVSVFIENELWNKRPYRNEYRSEFKKEHLKMISSIKIHIHIDEAPYSNFHSYEDIINKYIDLQIIDRAKILSSGISEASKIAVIEVEFESENRIIDTLSYEEEKDFDAVIENVTKDGNHNAWQELKVIKTIISEFSQFFIFNLHLNFLTQGYQFSFSEKPDLVGFTVVSDYVKQFYETDKIDFFAHYFLYEREKDILKKLMQKTSKFWHTEIASIHFFLDALKGINVTSTNFIKLVFTLESFFGKNTSNDFMTLTIPMLLSNDINSSKKYREIIKSCLDIRNEIVHGNKNYDFRMSTKVKNRELTELFFELKNILIKVFYYYINEGLYNSKHNEKINHEMMFNLFPSGISDKRN